MTGISKVRRTDHEALVASFLEQHPQAKTTGFMKALAALPGAPYVQELCADNPEWVEAVRIIPDAYVIDEEDRAVVLFEAVVTSDLSEAKADKIAEMAWALDQDCYTIGVVNAFPHGRPGELRDPRHEELLRLARATA